MKGDGTTQSAHGRYRIQTVAELTGVPASTLRAWEQRYGFPAPLRTASAYRLYTDADVARIARVRALCDSGMAAAEAVAAVMAEAGSPMPGDGAQAISRTSVASASLAGATSIAGPATTSVLDIAKLDGALRSALVIAPAAVALAQTIEPTWTRVRELWHRAEIDRAEHRVVAELLGHAIRDLVRIGQPASSNGHALLGGFGDDDDLVPLGRAALACHERGMRTLLLGGRTPAGVVADGVHRWAPRVVVMSCVEPPSASRARELMDDLAAAASGTPLVICGPGASEIPPSRRARVLLVTDLESVADAIAAACTGV